MKPPEPLLKVLGVAPTSPGGAQAGKAWQLLRQTSWASRPSSVMVATPALGFAQVADPWFTKQPASGLFAVVANRPVPNETKGSY